MATSQTIPTPSVLNVDPKPQPKSRRAKAAKPEAQPEAKSKKAPPAPVVEAKAEPKKAQTKPAPKATRGAFADSAVISVNEKTDYSVRGKRGMGAGPPEIGHDRRGV